MKFFLASASTYLIGSASASSITFLPNFLTDQDISSIHAATGINRNVRLENDFYQFSTHIGQDLHQRLRKELVLAAATTSNDDHGHGDAGRGREIGFCENSEEEEGGTSIAANVNGTDVYVTVALKDTTRHEDTYFEEDKQGTPVVEDKVGFVFLKTHPAAYFAYYDGTDDASATKVPIHQGTFVIFDGNIEHQTIIPTSNNNTRRDKNQHPVHLLGPFVVNEKSNVLSLIGRELSFPLSWGAVLDEENPFSDNVEKSAPSIPQTEETNGCFCDEYFQSLTFLFLSTSANAAASDIDIKSNDGNVLCSFEAISSDNEVTCELTTEVQTTGANVSFSILEEEGKGDTVEGSFQWTDFCGTDLDILGEWGGRDDLLQLVITGFTADSDDHFCSMQHEEE